MPGCAAIGCNNRSEKGYTMKCFPRDPILRQIWKDRVGRADWEPSNNSFLCHSHFAANQWMVTQCGRLKLRKGALPSIFRVVTNRKSPNKRRRLCADGESEDDECGIEILDDDDDDDEDDDEQDNFVYMESPGEVQDFEDESVVYLDSQNSSILQNITGKEGLSANNVYQIITTGPLSNLQHENVIMISDENDQEIGSFINDGNNYIIINNENEDTTNHLQPIEILTNQMPINSRIKVEVKDEMDDRATTDDIYNEVESNMERIYEGINSDDESSKQKKSTLRVYKNKSLGKIRKMENTKELNSESSWQKNDAILNGQLIPNDTIACLENSDDNSKSSLINPSFKNGDFLIEDTDEDVLGAKNTDQVSDLKAALQRKKKVREDTMKSIERIISDNGSFNKSPSGSESDFSDANSNSLNQGKENLSSKRSLDCSLEENQNQRQDYGDSCITSIVRVESSLPKIIKTERMSDAGTEDIHSDDLGKYSNKLELKQERMALSSESDLIEVDFQDENQVGAQDHHENQDREYQDDEIQEIPQDEVNCQGTSKRGIKRTRLSDDDCSVISTDIYRDLKLKVEQQEGVISQLTEHLSAYKGMEMKVTEVSDALKVKNREISILSAKLNRKESTQGRGRRNVVTMQELIKDLTNKVKAVEDVNRRLSRSLSVEHQNKKNLEYQVRNRERAIKELNWKVGKASKLLERAERNATTYKRRMNNMRALVRRRHFQLEDERQTPFDILFSDYARHEFTAESLTMALEIRRVCGSDGYEKLLEFNFPLPSQRTLRRKHQKDSVFTNGSNETTDSLDISIVEAKNVDKSNFKTVPCGIYEKNSRDSSVTVTGTVQDIFNENDSEQINENEVYSENELIEHLFKFTNGSL
ncbi:MATH and LRR domain-containing protein PFE0570w-like [Belonocnema kinseyi]|uniref:MATH and LRR domain-containing protein PFE0570w-like n=1 Tax=Belonocnema kinseyi TaxID=2817044 RepID=UPI00143D1151|nr:MATH and LRR domain-containing protein PFE0570w-like [Belonocnema kinseyi]